MAGEFRRRSFLGVTAALLASPAASAPPPPVTLLNVSYDPTRELYRRYNAAFCADWRRKTGQDVTIDQSHGGSAKQAQAVINGLPADVVTLGISLDIDAIARRSGLLPLDWRKRLPQDSAPYTSTVVFLVRTGNPRRIRDWPDLVQPGVQVITPNPKTSSGARWNYMAAYAFGARHGGPAAARSFLAKLFAHVPLLDTGARGATISFAERGIGDVLIAWENEALFALNHMDPGRFEIVAPSLSILAEPPVAWVDGRLARPGARPVAEAYLRGLYSRRGQEIIADTYYRPRDPVVLKTRGAILPQIPMVSINDFGGWRKAGPEQFGDGGVFDQIYRPA